MKRLSPAEALTFPGSLLSPDGRLVASYDLEEGDSSIAGYRAAAHQPGIFNAGLKAFRIDYRTKPDVHIVNGMGVTLGDSIIGLTAISALKHTFPDVKFTLYRPGRAPRYVEELYALAGHLVSARIALPFSPRDFPVGATVIDIGNHLFWPDFAALPMIDFFLGALGVEASSVTSSQKANRWLVPAYRCRRCRPRGRTSRTSCSAHQRVRRCAAFPNACARISSNDSCSDTICRYSDSGPSSTRVISTCNPRPRTRRTFLR